MPPRCLTESGLAASNPNTDYPNTDDLVAQEFPSCCYTGVTTRHDSVIYASHGGWAAACSPAAMTANRLNSAHVTPGLSTTRLPAGHRGHITQQAQQTDQATKLIRIELSLHFVIESIRHRERVTQTASALISEFDDAAPAVGLINALGHPAPSLQAIEQQSESGTVDRDQRPERGLIQGAALTEPQQHGELGIGQVGNSLLPQGKPRLARPAQLVRE